MLDLSMIFSRLQVQKWRFNVGYWSKKETDFAEIMQLLEQEPGQSARRLATKLGVAPSTIIRLLPSMEEAGFLLSEDTEGRLWPFKHWKR
jgi:predicted ArsR family transcriptional regulator